MDKMKMETENKTLENLAKLKEMFPEVITETRDENGEIVAAVDAKKLEQLLSTKVIEGDECYDFTWVGKKQAMVEACKPIRKTLRPCREESVDWENTQNLYIEGDNLDVLKLLQESYLNKVKMIYIDPPYNTGSDFIYNDNFIMNKDDYEDGIGLKDENEFIQFKVNNDSNPRFHSDWCSMMYSRLKLARNLLSEEGLIFISIGVEELVTLKAICNEVFGENNFIEVFSWVKTSTPPSLATKSRKTNEYILCFEKNKNNKQYNGEALDGGDQPLLNTGNTIRTLLFPKEKVYFKHSAFPNAIYKPYCKDRVKLLDEIEIIDGYATSDFRLEGEFKWTQEFLDEEINKGTTFIIKKDTLSIRFIRLEDGYKRPTNFIKDKYTSPLIDKSSQDVGTNENASSYLAKLMDGSNVFSYPKPVTLIKYLINFLCEDNDIVMDFFSGSGTTAEAVNRYNTEYKKALKYILVQLPENLDETIKKADNNAKEIISNGIKFLENIAKPHLLTELAKERIRRAGKKIVEETGKKDIDIGFRVLKLDSSNMKDVYYAPADYKQTMLEKMTSNIEDGRTAEDLLYACMLEWGVELSLPHKVQKISDFNVHIVNNGDLVACFDDKVSEEAIKQIAEMKPLRAVFRDSSFATDAARVNVGEIFKLKSPNTTIKVL